MAERKALRKRALPALLVAGFGILALGMVAIHQQGRQSELLLTQSRRAMLRLKMDDFFALLKHPVRDESRWHAAPMPLCCSLHTQYRTPWCPFVVLSLSLSVLTSTSRASTCEQKQLSKSVLGSSTKLTETKSLKQQKKLVGK